MKRHDAVIVGGGPAGSTLAALLATAGFDVLLLDRSAFPRPKPCGESLNPGAVRRLEELGLLQDVLRLPHGRIDGWMIHPDRGPPLECDFPRGRFGLAVDRGALDDLLLSAAVGRGATFGIARVTDILRGGGRVVGVRTAEGEEHHGRIVVGADGLRSVVVRRVGLIRRTPRLRKVALTAHLRAARPLGRRGILSIRGRRCLGLVGVGAEVVNAVLVLPEDEARRARRDIDSTFDAAVRDSPHLTGAERCSPVRATGPFDWPTRAVTAPGALVVGDAAGYFDPFTGQGIGHALGGAIAAAGAIAAHFASPGAVPPPLDSYARWHDRTRTRAVRVQRIIEIGLARPRLFDAAISALRLLPPLATRVLSIVGDLEEADPPRLPPELRLARP